MIEWRITWCIPCTEYNMGMWACLPNDWIEPKDLKNLF
jgi:hypothetical protein